MILEAKILFYYANKTDKLKYKVKNCQEARNFHKKGKKKHAAIFLLPT